MTHEEKDPTPPHGTPRPKPCAVLGCDWFTADGLYCRQHVQVLEDYASVCEFAELWLDDNTDTENTHDRIAKTFFQQALNTLHGLVMSSRLGDAEWHSVATKNAERLLGFVACAMCGDMVESDEADLDGLCGGCTFDTLTSEEQDATLNPWVNASFTLVDGVAGREGVVNPFGGALER